VRIKLLFILFVLFSIPLLFSQDDVKVNINLSKNGISVNEVFQINVEIVGVSDNASIENIENLDSSIMLKPSGTMSNISFVNGVFTSSLIYTYLAKIVNPGNYEIGPFVVKAGNKTIKSEKIKIPVSDITDKNLTNVNKFEEEPNKDQQFYILELNKNKTELYVNEPLEVEVLFYAQTDFRFRDYQSLKFPSASWVERINIEKENTDEAVKKNNKDYIMRKCEKFRVFISKPGKYLIEPAKLDILGITSASYFSNMELIRLKTPAFEITVNPIPENSNSDFKDAVGTFKLNYNLSPLRLKEKELLTLNIKLEGNGNFQNINEVKFEHDDSIEVYSNNITISEKGQNREKSWEILLVPQKQGRHKLKIKDFIYFDVQQNKYITLKGKDFNINVLKNEELNTESNDKLVITDSKIKTDGANKEFYNNIQNIRFNIGSPVNIFYKKFWFNYLLIFYSILLLSVILILLFRTTFINNFILTAFKNNKTPYMKFIKRIKIFKEQFDEKSFDKQTDKISSIIESYLIQKFDIDTIEFTVKSIENTLKDRLDSSIILKLKNIINKLDLMRFGEEKITKDDFFDIVKSLTATIKKIENR